MRGSCSCRIYDGIRASTECGSPSCSRGSKSRRRQWRATSERSWRIRATGPLAARWKKTESTGASPWQNRRLLRRSVVGSSSAFGSAGRFPAAPRQASWRPSLVGPSPRRHSLGDARPRAGSCPAPVSDFLRWNGMQSSLRFAAHIGPRDSLSWEWKYSWYERNAVLT